MSAPFPKWPDAAQFKDVPVVEMINSVELFNYLLAQRDAAFARLRLCRHFLEGCDYVVLHDYDSTETKITRSALLADLLPPGEGR